MVCLVRQFPVPGNTRPTQTGKCLPGSARSSLAGAAVKVKLDVTLKVSKRGHWVASGYQKASVATTTAIFQNIAAKCRPGSRPAHTARRSSCQASTGQRWLQRPVLPAATSPIIADVVVNVQHFRYVAAKVELELAKGVLAEYSHRPGFWPSRTLNGSVRDRHEARNPKPDIGKPANLPICDRRESLAKRVPESPKSAEWRGRQPVVQYSAKCRKNTRTGRFV